MVGVTRLAMRSAPAITQSAIDCCNIVDVVHLCNPPDLLFLVALYILWEAVRRFREPAEVQSLGMLLVALLGLAVNAASMWLLRGRGEGLGGEGAQATAMARAFWRSQNLSETQERAFLAASATVALSVLLALTLLPWSRLGSEFMPPLNEGSILYMPTTLPGLSTDAARALLQQGQPARLIEDYGALEVQGAVAAAGLQADLGLAWLMRGDVELAARAFERALSIQPGHPVARLGKARIAAQR